MGDTSTPERKSSRCGASMSDEPTNTEHSLEVVHVCEKCGTSLKYAQVSEDVTVTGVVECPVCRHVGPLQVKIRGTTR